MAEKSPVNDEALIAAAGAAVVAVPPAAAVVAVEVFVDELLHATSPMADPAAMTMTAARLSE